MPRWEPSAKDRLREAALALFLDRGFENVTVTDITDHAGLTRRTFSRYFADKRDVLFAGSDRLPEVVSKAVRGVDAGLGPAEALLAGLADTGAILAKHYVNASFLINQLVPMAGSIATAGTDIPLDASNINVGTEFFPFLMALGASGALASIIVLYALLAWSVRRLYPSVPLFPLLIFLRVAYVCLMSPFAPQAYTWTNAGFIVLCLLMQLFAAWLPNRNAAPAVSTSFH